MTHAICERCWAAEDHPGEDAYRLPGLERVPETCCWCGEITGSGIYTTTSAADEPPACRPIYRERVG